MATQAPRRPAVSGSVVSRAKSSEGAAFISYAREDQGFVRQLSEALQAGGHVTWVDWSGIQPTADWMSEVKAAIVASAAFVYVISPASARSRVCREEVGHAVALNKRILPVLHQEVDPDDLPEAIASRNWISVRPGELSAAVESIGRALDTDPEWVAAHSRLLVRAAEWAQHERDPSYALRGQDLSQAEAWLTSADDLKDPQPTLLQADLIISSRRLATRGQRVRMAVLTIGLVVALSLAAYALVERNRADDRARQARSRELAATAVAQSDNNPELALLLAVRAAAVDNTDEAQSAVRQTLVNAFGRGVLVGHHSSVNSVDFDARGHVLATGGNDGTARVWDVAERTEKRSMDPNAGIVTDVAITPDGKRLVVGTSRGSVSTWSVGTGQLARRLTGMSGAVEGVDIGPGGHLIAASGRDGIRIWGKGGRSPSPAQGHRGRVWGVAFSPDGRRLVSAGADGTARIWAVRTGHLLRTLVVGRPEGPFGRDVNSAEFSPNGKLVLTASDDGSARVWSADDGRLLTIIRASETSTYSAAFSPDGRRVVTGSLDGSARMWFLPPAGRRSATTKLTDPVSTLRGPAGEVDAVAFAPNGRTVATAHSDGSVRLWDPGQKDVISAIAARDAVTKVAVSSDGSRFATAGVDGSVYIRDINSGTPVEPPLHYNGVVYSVAFSPDGSRIASAFGGGRVTVRSPGAAPTLALHPSLKVIYGITFSPDGTRVAGAGIGGGLAWSLSRSVAPVRLDTGGVTLADIAFSPDGRHLAGVGQDGTLRVWDSTTGAQLVEIPAHRGIAYGVAYSPDGQTIATAGGGDRSARLWDADTGQPIRTLSAHSAGVTSVAFSRDGEELVTGSDDRTVRVWDTSSGSLLDTLVGPKDSVTAVTYNRNGTRILASSLDRHTYILRCSICLPFDALLAIAAHRVKAALTPQERLGYLRELEG